MQFNKIISLVIALILAKTTCSPVTAQSRDGVSALQCEHLSTPLGVDFENPRLSWLIESNRRGSAQSAFRLIVGKDSATVSALKGVDWDSGKITSGLNLTTYAGKKLSPFTRYFWKVLVWNEKGKQIAASKVTNFETGMMGPSGWRGAWISDRNNIDSKPAPYFRKLFGVTKKVVTARAYIAVGGLYELYLNGKKVGNHRLDPMYTRFDRRNLYVTYDVTHLLQNGDNAVGVLLGNGWYNHQSIAVWDFDKAPWRARPLFALNLRIIYDDGSVETITSDQTWKSHTGPIVLNSIYTAEHFDSRLDMPGWNTTKFDDRTWTGVALRAAPSQNIVSQVIYPIRDVERVPATTLKKLSDTSYIFNLGRNISGVSQITLSGAEGTVVRLKHGERLREDGHVDLSNIDVYYRPKDDTDPFGTDVVILNGKGNVKFAPKFNYKGFQYVEVSSNKPIQLNKDDLVGLFMHSDVPAVGYVNSSNTLLNRLWKATNNSYLSNLFGYPTDCPQREKNGWTGDGHFAVETGLYNFDAITIYEKWMADHRDEQQPNGVLPDIIPTGGWGYGTANGTDWTSSVAIIPWTLYLFYGDSKPLKDNYQAIRQYLHYVESISPSGLTTFGRGDWVPVKSSSPLEYTSSVYYFVDTQILAKSAALLGNKDDEKYYRALGEKIKNAINNKYFNTSTGLYGGGLQTELSVALQWGIVPEGKQQQVAANLAKRVRADGMHLDVGVLGARAILNALSDNGQAETAYSLAIQDTYPSWGWWIVNGATTLYENWDIKAERDISLNHMMFGDIGGWFFKGIGGIKPDERQPGFKNVLLRPNFVNGLDHFEASHRGPYGLIRSNWKRSGNKITYNVVLPANTTASVSFSLKSGQNVYLDGRIYPASFNLMSGSYELTIK
jgi:alpha-L-rhamnosidase